MKKMLMLLLAVAFVCAACEKEDNFTMPVDELAGTYWVLYRETYAGYKYGEYVSADMDPLKMDGFCSHQYHFSEGGYITLHTYVEIDNDTYKTMSYTYDKERHLLVFDGEIHRLVRLTPEQMVWEVEYNSESSQLTYTYYYERFEPDKKWFEMVSGFENRTGEE